MIKLGYNIINGHPILVDVAQTGHLAIIGGTGTGKSVATLYFIYGLIKNYKTSLFICDFKKTGDYKGLVSNENYFEFENVSEGIEAFHAEFERTPENSPQLKILLLDEYAGYIIWLTQNAPKKATEIKNKISTLLMLGRSRHCFVWCIQQRMSATLFPSGIGAIDNFQICVGLGRLSVDSRKSLFAGEHLSNIAFEENYHPKMGQGLALIDGQELQPIQIPYIKSKERLKMLIQKMQK